MNPFKSSFQISFVPASTQNHTTLLINFIKYIYSAAVFSYFICHYFSSGGSYKNLQNRIPLLQKLTGVSNTTFTSDTSCKFGVPQITLRFNNSLGFTALRMVVILTVVVYYTERTEIKISRGKRHTEKGPGEIRHRTSGCPLPVEPPGSLRNDV